MLQSWYQKTAKSTVVLWLLATKFLKKLVRLLDVCRLTVGRLSATDDRLSIVKFTCICYDMHIPDSAKQVPVFAVM